MSSSIVHLTPDGRSVVGQPRVDINTSLSAAFWDITRLLEQEEDEWAASWLERAQLAVRTAQKDYREFELAS